MKHALALLALLVSIPASVRADEAGHPCPPMLEPAQISFRESGFDVSRSACVSNRFQLGARSFAVIDEPNYYGTLAGSLFFDWSTTSLGGFEVGLGARLLDARFVQSAVLASTELSAGPVRAWAVRPRDTELFGWPAVISHALLLDVPFTNFSLDEPTVAATPSFLVTLAPTDGLRWHNRAAVLLWAALPERGPDRRIAAAISSDVSMSTWSWLAFTLGAEAQTGWYGWGLDHLVPRGGLRIGWTGEHAIELTGGSAVLGEERADLSLWIGYRYAQAPEARRSRLGNW